MVTETKKNVERKEKFTQVCVWPGTIIKDAEIPDFEKFFKDEVSARVQYLETIKTLPDKNEDGTIIEDTGGRSDVFFAVHDDDVMGFSIPRLQFGIRWIEDVLGNEEKYSLYPDRVKDYCSWDYSGDGPEDNTFEKEPDENKPITDVNVKMVGEDGNAFAIIGRVTKAMRRAGVDKDIIEKYKNEAMSGDYNNLIVTTMKYCHIDENDDEDEE